MTTAACMAMQTQYPSANISSLAGDPDVLLRNTVESSQSHVVSLEVRNLYADCFQIKNACCFTMHLSFGYQHDAMVETQQHACEDAVNVLSLDGVRLKHGTSMLSASQLTILTMPPYVMYLSIFWRRSMTRRSESDKPRLLMTSKALVLAAYSRICLRPQCRNYCRACSNQ